MHVHIYLLNICVYTYIYICAEYIQYKCSEHTYIYIYIFANLLIALWCTHTVLRTCLGLSSQQMRSQGALFNVFYTNRVQYSILTLITFLYGLVPPTTVDG